MRIRPRWCRALGLSALASLASPALVTAAVITVTSVGDAVANDGACTLREAIISANTNPVPIPPAGECANGAAGLDTIQFNITTGCNGVTGVCTIQPASSLPTIIEPVFVNGYSQSGASMNTLANGDNAVLTIEIDGTNATPGSYAFSIVNTGSGSTVQGFVINRFTTDGSGNGGGGFFLDVASNNTIAGNFIGVNALGTAASSNGGAGIFGLDASANNTIGGTTPGARNVISSNGHGGIVLGNTGTTGNLILGNFIGTNASGTAAIPNDGGIILNSCSGNTIGGTAAGARNVISGNFSLGIDLENNSTNHVVQGNFIGTDVTGTLPVPNGTPWGGILLSDGFSGPASLNSIGGTAPGAGNIIAFNAGRGVTIGPTRMFQNMGNAVLGNSIHSNSGLGIDLNDDGVTANDATPGDPDTGPNGLQNFPVITGVTPGVGVTTIQGTLNSTPSSNFLLQFFSNSACDPSGNGEGQTFLGATIPGTVTTNGTGDVTFSVTVPTVVSAGQFITGTATNLGPAQIVLSNGIRTRSPRGVLVSPGPTSEFSACFTVGGGITPSPTPTVTNTPAGVATATSTPTVTPGGPTLTPSPTPSITATPTNTATPTPTITPGGPTLTPTITNTPAGAATATPTLAPPTATPTVVTGGGSPAGNIPTLSGGMLAFLALALAAAGFFLLRRT